MRRILFILLFLPLFANGQFLINSYRHASGGGAPSYPTTNLRSAHFGDVGVTHSSNNVSSWADQSGNGRNFTQGTGANQPNWDGSAGITFNGSSDYLSMSYTVTQEANVYMVVEYIGTAAQQILGGTFENIYWGRDGGDILTIASNSGGGLLQTTATMGTENIKYLVSFTANNASSSAQINANTATTGSLSYSGNFGTTLRIGCFFLSGSPFLYGNFKLYAILIYGSQTSGEKADTKTYLNNKYSIY